MMNETEINRLRNVYRLTGSPIEGEANAALAMTKKLLSAHGKKMSDLSDILRGMSDESRARKPSTEGFWAGAAAAAATARWRKEEAEAAARQAERRRDAAIKRAAALAKTKAAKESKQRSDDRIRLRLRLVASRLGGIPRLHQLLRGDPSVRLKGIPNLGTV